MGKELYSAKKTRKSRSFRDWEDCARVGFAPNRVLPGYGKEGEGGAAQWGRVAEREEVGARLSSAERRTGLVGRAATAAAGPARALGRSGEEGGAGLAGH